jgi:signal transduction histidine kinase
MQVKTQFGEYKVSSDIFTAQSYNEYLQKMLNAITTNFAKVASNGHKTEMPLMQINQTLLISAIDRYIRTRLFNQEFDPMVDGNWRVLILSKATIIQHTMTELSKAIYEMHNQLNVHEAEVEKHWFSEVDKLVGRENYALDIRSAAESLLSLINDILDLSKIESGKMHLVEQEYRTEELIRGMVKMIRIRSDQKGLSFDLDIFSIIQRPFRVLWTARSRQVCNL